MLPANFWDEEADDLYSNTARVMLAIYLAGTRAGDKALPANFRVLVKWDVVNRAALDFLRQYRLSTVRNLTDTTRENLTAIINEWMQSGEPLDMLITRMEPWVGKNRAERIAVTEVTRTYASGNIAAWASTGIVSAKRWNTANDELVCPYCGPLNGKIVDLGGDFRLEDLPAGENPDEIIFFQPPAHPNCRCWLTPIVSTEAVRSARRNRLGL